MTCLNSIFNLIQCESKLTNKIGSDSAESNEIKFPYDFFNVSQVLFQHLKYMNIKLLYI